MIKHTAIKAGIGIGLMAASLGAGAADLHSFAMPSIYYKMDGSIVKYVGFLPSGAGATDSLVMLDMYQSGSISTWAFAVGGPFGDLGGSSASTASTAFASHSNGVGGQAWRAAGSMYYMTPQASTTSATVSTFFGGDSRALSMQFAVTPTISSQACLMTFKAVLDTNDYLQFPTNSITVRPSAFPTFAEAADNLIKYRTKSGTSASDTTSIGPAAFNALNAIATWSLPTFAAYTLYSTTGAGATSDTVFMSSAAVSLFSAPFNKCVGAYTARTSTNSAGNIIGGLGGMMRLW